MANAAENEKWLKIEKWICQKWTPFVTLIRTESVEGMNKSLVWVKQEERSGGGDSVNRQFLRYFSMKGSREMWFWPTVLERRNFCLFNSKCEILEYCVLKNIIFKKEVLMIDEKEVT